MVSINTGLTISKIFVLIGGAKEDDILAAMKIHMKQEEIKLPPIPEHIK